jgi:hypothetical protein
VLKWPRNSKLVRFVWQTSYGSAAILSAQQDFQIQRNGPQVHHEKVV